MKLIDKAWEINNQYNSKEEIIKGCCPCGRTFNLISAEKFTVCDKDCIKCWNKEIKEDNKLELNFKNLHQSPIEEITLNWNNEEDFIKGLKQGVENIICIDESEKEVLTYSNLPIIATYCSDVYKYCTQLKNKVVYSDFNHARIHMNLGNKAKFEDKTYYIKDNELYYENLKCACGLKLKAIESDKWILL